MKRTFYCTAEHCSGASVGHPCTNGVYSDPTDQFEFEWQIDDATGIPTADLIERAESAAWDALRELVSEYEPCKCRRHLEPGYDSWWNSVAIHAEEKTTS